MFLRIFSCSPSRNTLKLNKSDRQWCSVVANTLITTTPIKKVDTLWYPLKCNNKLCIITQRAQRVCKLCRINRILPKINNSNINILWLNSNNNNNSNNNSNNSNKCKSLIIASNSFILLLISHLTFTKASNIRITKILYLIHLCQGEQVHNTSNQLQYNRWWPIWWLKAHH